eukprot:3242262-Prymnesium_polylepis.1
MWRTLNRSNLELYMHRANTKNSTTDPTANRSPAHLVGPCNATCAAAYWSQYRPFDEVTDGANGVNGPVCGVPGCS